MNHAHKDEKHCCAILLPPSPGDLTGPYPALPYLKSYAELHAHSVRVRDLGIDALYFLTREDNIRYLMDRAETMRQELESR
jgi:hypothetical protein